MDDARININVKSIEQFLEVSNLKMVRDLEIIEYICLVISVCNLIAVGFAMRKQKSINKIMYFVNILGIIVLSNLIVWMEGCYVDENNLNGSAITFILNICNIVFFIVSSMMLFKCKKIEYNRFKEEFMN